MANQDRISEVYKGEVFSPEVQRRARDRIQWMCRQAEGLTLDLGCSQGIASILLAREGLQVVGVDLEFDRLQYAQADRRVEPPAVADRVSFVAADAFRLPFRDGIFHTLLLGEVLQHVGEPEELLGEVGRVLSPEGKAIVTTPFGYHKQDDPRVTFYFGSLLALIGEYLTPRKLEVADGYLRLVASAGRGPAAAADMILAYQPMLERAFLEAEQALRRLPGKGQEQAVQELQQRIEKQDQELGRLGRALVVAKKRAGEQERALAEGREQLAERDRRLEGLTRRVDELVLSLQKEREQADRYKQRIEKLHRDRIKLSNRLARANWKLEATRQRKWWRLASALQRAVRNPLQLLLLPLEGARIILSPSKSVKPPDSLPYTPAFSEDGVERLPSSTPKDREDRPQQAASTVPSPRSLTLSRPIKLAELRVAGILDTMSTACLAPELDLLTFRPDNWRQVLTGLRPDLLLVESAWEGNQRSWQYKVGTYAYHDSVGLPDLSALVEWCRSQGIPTIFWNKEDPVHFDRFKQAAILFDVVFSSDADCVPRYLELPGLRAEVVEALPFAAQPQLHNPIGAPTERRPEPCFAGTYYRNRHPERRKQLEMLLDAARPFGLVIYDRTQGSDSQSFGFPDRFLPHVVGGIPYEEMVWVYKQHRVFLNANSVVGSPTMFSRRVFELLACGTAVVSTPSLGLEKMLGGVVTTVEEPEEAAQAIERLIHDDVEWRRVSAEGIRRVMTHHTYAHRLREVVAAAGYEASMAESSLAMAALVDDQEPTGIASILERQSLRPTEVVLGWSRHPPEERSLQRIASLGGVRVRAVDQTGVSSRSDRFRRLASLCSSPWVAVLDPRHAYEPIFIEDLLACARFSGADVIGKFTYRLRDTGEVVNQGIEHRFVRMVHPAAALVRRSLMAARGWPDEDEQAPREMERWFAEGVRFYSSGDEGFAAASRMQGLEAPEVGMKARA